MKKLIILGMGVCVALAFTSCKSSESAYKKAYEKAKEQELASSQQVAPVETPSIAAPPVVAPPVVVERTPVAPEAGVRREKVTLISGDDLKDYSVVCGSFGLKVNAEALRDYLVGQGYNAVIAFNVETAMYRVVAGTYPDRSSAIAARNALKNRYPNRKDFQGAWLLYRLY
ncbi:MAG: SPOR domain-containing protein [Mediterranea sp.]|jgi:cell division protein FtsN|nr:SPOR domain-containing protein [Mediterranea sp.]